MPPLPIPFTKLRKMFKYIKANPTSSTAHNYITKIVKNTSFVESPSSYRTTHSLRVARRRVLLTLGRLMPTVQFGYCAMSPISSSIYAYCELVEIWGTIGGRVSKQYITSNTRYFALCSQCGKMAHQSFISSVVGDAGISDTLCKTCSVDRNLYYYCDNCRAHHPVGYVCTAMPVVTVHTYDTDVLSCGLDFLIQPNEIKKHNTMFYGVELEVIASHSCAARQVADTLRGFAILKRDGSLSSGGFEIVTAPATLDYHRAVGWHKLFKSPVSNSITSWKHRCCGLHIHMSRSAMTPLQQAKLLVFMHSPDNSWFLSKIAGREVNRHSTYFRQERKTYGISIREVPVKELWDDGSRSTTTCSTHNYAASISPRNGSRTIEIRIFKGNATYHGVIRAIEFCDALSLFCSQSSVKSASFEYKHSGLSFQEALKKYNIDSPVADTTCKGSKNFQSVNYVEFLMWFDQQNIRGMYPELWKHLISLGLLTTGHRLGAYDKETNKLIPFTTPTEKSNYNTYTTSVGVPQWLAEIVRGSSVA